jgi:hypothetical protein
MLLQSMQLPGGEGSSPLYIPCRPTVAMKLYSGHLVLVFFYTLLLHAVAQVSIQAFALGCTLTPHAQNIKQIVCSRPLHAAADTRHIDQLHRVDR